MASPTWPSPPSFSPAPPAWRPASAPAYELRPLSMGEVLDRTFSVYRRNFWLIVGLASLYAVVQLVITAVQMLINHVLHPPMVGAVTTTGQHITGRSASIASVSINVVGALIVFIAAAVVQAGIVYALSEVYLGRSTSVKASLEKVTHGWWAYPLIALWQFLSFAWLPAIFYIPLLYLAFHPSSQGMIYTALLGLCTFVAVIGGMFLYLRNALAIPVQVVENPGVRGSMRRSKKLTKGAIGTLLVLGLIFFALYIAALSVIGFLAIFKHLHTPGSVAGNAGGLMTFQIVTMALTFVIQALLIPVMLVGIAVIYFNQRVKQEAFDLLVLLGPEGSPAIYAPASPASTLDAPLP